MLARCQPGLLRFGADLEIELHDQGAVIALLGFELVDLIVYAGHRILRGTAEHAVVEHAAVPAAIEDRGLARARQLAPETGQPMAFARLAPVVSGRVNREVTWVECGCDLLQRRFLARAVGPFEQDDGALAERDLRKLQLAELLAQRGKRRIRHTNSMIGDQNLHATRLSARRNRHNAPQTLAERFLSRRGTLG